MYLLYHGTNEGNIHTEGHDEKEPTGTMGQALHPRFVLTCQQHLLQERDDGIE